MNLGINILRAKSQTKKKKNPREKKSNKKNLYKIAKNAT